VLARFARARSQSPGYEDTLYGCDQLSAEPLMVFPDGGILTVALLRRPVDKAVACVEINYSNDFAGKSATDRPNSKGIERVLL